MSAGLGSLARRLRAVGDRPLARNSASVMLAQLVRLGTQAVYFVLVARSLGPDGYGAFATVAAFVGALAPFAAWGAGDRLVQHVSRDRASFAEEWSTALLTLAVVGGGGVVAVVAGAWLLLPHVPIALVVCVALAEFWFAAVVSVGAQAFQATERLGRTGQAWVLLSVCRLTAAAVLMAWGRVDTASPMHWGVLYLVGTAVAALVVIRTVAAEIGRPFWRRGRRIDDARRRLYYSVSLSAYSVYNDIDKTMLGRLASDAAAGVYAAGYRAVEMAYAPVNALLVASYPAFFQHGANGVGATIRLARRLLPPALGYCVVAGVGLWLGADVMSRVLAEGFSDVGGVIRLLAAVPLLRTVHFFAANALTGADRQAVRSAVQVGAAAGNVALNLWLIPTHGWVGAAWATLGTELLLVVMLWGAVVACATREPRAPHPAPTVAAV